MSDLVVLARQWKARPPSGKFIVHRLKCDQYCKTCGGYVSKWHRHWKDGTDG